MPDDNLPTICPACGFDELEERLTGELLHESTALVGPKCGPVVEAERDPREDDCD